MIYIDFKGERVETQDAEADLVKFYKQGGGFEHNMPHTLFHQIFSPAPPPTWRAGTVTAEWLPGKVYQCWSNGELHNGSGMPAFTPNTVNTVLADLAAAGMDETVKWDDGKLIHTDPDGDDPCELVPFTVPGCVELLYPFGGFWTWDAVEFDKET